MAPKIPSIAMEYHVHENAKSSGPARVAPVQRPAMVGQESLSLVLTAYIERPSGSIAQHQRLRSLPNRTTTARQLQKLEFPSAQTNTRAYCTRPYEYLPVNQYPDQDPFLPWIHDYVITADASRVRFVAQNKRRCETGEGKEAAMEHLEPQIALFQGVSVIQQEHGQMRLTGHRAQATANATRFVCRFHNESAGAAITFSEFDFNYEYVLWRKGKLPMFKKQGADVSIFETSQLLFSCPIPKRYQPTLQSLSDSPVYLDIVPIRTAARQKPWLDQVQVEPSWSDVYEETDRLPGLNDSGRWSNLPICAAPALKKHRLVACTWTSASYNRRGDSTVISDSAERLREWIVYHNLVGVDHIYVYDNTDGDDSPLKSIAESFPFVTYLRWPATICSNNRPNFKNPGERSSQYAADSSCRVRYGDYTEWMTFIDTDEYLVPANHSSWHDVLDTVGAEFDVLKMRSSRGRPRLKYMEVLANQSVCAEYTRTNEETNPCVGRKSNETFLRLYNCDYIRHPRPDRFSRAMKQIYRPSQVLSHFVHYSTVTKRIATNGLVLNNTKPHRRTVSNAEYRDVFLDELTQGSLLHAKTVLPYETRTWEANCKHASKHGCAVGLECPDSTQFNDAIHQKNLFQDELGDFCNCWVDPNVEHKWLPLLEQALQAVRGGV